LLGIAQLSSAVAKEGTTTHWKCTMCYKEGLFKVQHSEQMQETVDESVD